MSDWLLELTPRDATNVSMGLAIASGADGMSWPWVMIQFGAVALAGIATLAACDWLTSLILPPSPERGGDADGAA